MTDSYMETMLREIDTEERNKNLSDETISLMNLLDSVAQYLPEIVEETPKSEIPPSNTVFVGNLCYTTTEYSLKTFVEMVGPTKRIKIIDKSQDNVCFNKKSRRVMYAFVTFIDKHVAASAVRNLDKLEFLKRNVVVNYAQRKTV